MNKNILVYIILVLTVTYSFGQNIDYSKFKGKKIKVNQITQINKPFIYDYQVNSSNGLDSLIFNIIPNKTAERILTENKKNLFLKNKEKKNNFLKLKYKLIFENQGYLVSIIKYNEVKDSIISLPKSIVLIKKNNIWKEIDSENAIIIEYVVRNIGIEAFWQFYNNEDDSRYPEINNLKPLVKDANGVLNIEKLAKVLKENKGALSKYLND